MSNMVVVQILCGSQKIEAKAGFCFKNTRVIGSHK